MRRRILTWCGLFLVGFASGCLAMLLVPSKRKNTDPLTSSLPARPRSIQTGASDSPKSEKARLVIPSTINSRTKQLLEEYAELVSADSSGPNAALVSKMRDYLVSNRDESRRTLQFNLLLEGMRADDAPAVAELFNELKRSGLEFHDEANFFAQRWGELDPDAALAFVVEDGKFERGGVLLDRVMSGWASQAPNEAAQWVLEQADGPLKNAALAGTATGWGRTDPAGATQFLLKLPDDQARNSAAQTIFWQILYVKGMEAAAEWYDALPADQPMLRRAVFQHIAARQRQRGDPEADKWVQERKAALSQ